MKKKENAVSLFLIAVCLAALMSGCRRREDEEALAEIVLQETEDTYAEVSGTEGGASDLGIENGNAEGAGTQVSAQECYIHIYGAVKNPGVYLMNPGDRIFQAVERAGGFTDDACEDYVNQAKSVEDGLKIWIPTKQEAEQRREGEEETAQRAGKAADAEGGTDDNAGLFYPTQEAQMGGKVNINTAAQEELCTLTGIGEAKAQAIIAYRETHGRFAKPEDIMKVTGIKQSGYEKIQNQITVG